MTTVETQSLQNPLADNVSGASAKKSREAEQRRRRRNKQKNNKKNKKASQAQQTTASDGDEDAKENNDPDQQTVEIEYVPEEVELSQGMDDEFKKIFEKFKLVDAKPAVDVVVHVVESDNHTPGSSSENEEQQQDDQQKQKQENRVSNRVKKLQQRMKLAELKQMCARPDLVEVWDVTAADPKLLVYLKSYRNTVPVPRHWCQKRKYLQGKRGIEKKPFQLPESIAATGIEKLRDAYLEKQEGKKLKQKQRERMQPKKIMDMDYEVLYRAFLRYKKEKPKLTTLGDVYHEGKEFEVKVMKMKKPGILSREIKEALGMVHGAPPPWIINMQKYGPPPSYSNQKIPGVNAPIPAGASFGYHIGGWGKPPVDEYGQPLYGDVFGSKQQDQPDYEEAEEPDKRKHWGDIEEEEYTDDEQIEEIEEEEDLEDGNESVDSFSSAPTDFETPSVIDLRKQPRKELPERDLYQVLEKKEERIGAGTLLGVGHTYVVGSGSTQGKLGAKRVDVSLQPEELESMENILPEKYEQARQEERLQSQREDFSDLVADNEKKRKRKMQEKEGKSNKKKKDFKF